jgi:hypothetical protein
MPDALDADLIARRREIGLDEWPYGVQTRSEQEQMLKWAEDNNLRFTETNLRCPHWLIRSRSSDIAGRYSKRGSYLYDDIHHADCRGQYGLDHVTCWTREGRPVVIVSQPYNLYTNQLQSLGALASEKLSVKIHGRGWYGNETVCVEIWVDAEDHFD